MRIDLLPLWAQTAVSVKAPFGSEEGEGPANGEGTPSEAETPSPEIKKTVDENQNPQLTPEQIQKILRENAEAKNNVAAFQKEKEEREAAEEKARRATASKEENLTKDVTRLTEENQRLATVNERNILKIAILENENYKWHKASDVEKLIDRSEIKIDTTTGKIDGVESALKALAKDKPYMLKGSEDAGAGNPQSGTPVPGQPSGGVPKSGDDSKKANKRKQLQQRFSVLNV